MACPRGCDNGLLEGADPPGSMYPCPDCNRSKFVLWQGGHFAPDHDRARCHICRDAAKGRPVRGAGALS